MVVATPPAGQITIIHFVVAVVVELIRVGFDVFNGVESVGQTSSFQCSEPAKLMSALQPFLELVETVGYIGLALEELLQSTAQVALSLHAGIGGGFHSLARSEPIPLPAH